MALTDAQRKLVDEARRFALDEVLPVANRLDPRKEDIPGDLLDKLAARGYFGIMVPEEYGGMGLGVLEYCLISEQLARAWMSAASIIARGNSLVPAHALSPEQRDRLLPRIARGTCIACFALSEPEAGSDAASLQTRAEREGDGWAIYGRKKWAGLARRSDVYLVWARTDPPPDPGRKHRGISLFLIEKERGSLPEGVTGSPIDKIGYYGMTTWRLEFNGCRVPDEALIGERGGGFKYAMEGLNVARLHTAARAIGLATGALEDAAAYASQRRQFGVPIDSYQAIRFKFADMATEIEAARHLTYGACRAADEGQEISTQAAMAKLFASEMCQRVTGEALQILGGAGYTTEHAVERYWRDAKLTTIFEGTSEIQRKIISDKVLGGGG